MPENRETKKIKSLLVYKKVIALTFFFLPVLKVDGYILELLDGNLVQKLK